MGSALDIGHHVLCQGLTTIVQLCRVKIRASEPKPLGMLYDPFNKIKMRC